MQKGQVLIFLIVGILILAFAGGAYYLGRSSSPKSSPTPTVISQTPQPTLVPSPGNDSPVPPVTGETVNPDSIGANWKTFTDDEFKYSFKYPANFWISSVKTNRSGNASIGDGMPTKNAIGAISIIQDKMNETISIEEWANSYMKNYPEFQVLMTKNISVDSRPAIYIDTLINKEYNSLFAFINNKSAKIQLDTSNISLNGKVLISHTELTSIFEKILSTFKFL